jgi:hypothetical protein
MNRLSWRWRPACKTTPIRPRPIVDATGWRASFASERGDRTGDYDVSVARRFDDYLANRNYFYGMEKRWADASFWKIRVARASL